MPLAGRLHISRDGACEPPGFIASESCHPARLLQHHFRLSPRRLEVFASCSNYDKSNCFALMPYLMDTSSNRAQRARKPFAPAERPVSLRSHSAGQSGRFPNAN
jgi:hypothetical protein